MNDDDEIPLVDKSPKFKKRNEFPEDPPETEWAYVCPCNCIPLAKLTSYNSNRIFFRGIELKFESLVLVFISSLILFTYSVFCKYVLPQFQGTLKYFSFIEMTIVTVLFLWSYFSAACSDPGFLPYDWYLTQKDWYSWEDQLTGLAITEVQYIFVDMHERPKNASFSRSSGRFVIRGDHICDWICNWVGKRNHKQFLLLMVWGILYSFSIPFWLLFTKMSVFSSFQYSLLLISLVLGLIFGSSLTIFFVSSLFLVLSSKTKIQEMKNLEIHENKTCIDALSEICGTGTKLLWLLPIPAFEKELPVPTRIDCL